jgi:NAD-dependent deacetylase
MDQDQIQIQKAAHILRGARNVAVMTGAGIGRPSGIPDFRSPGGLWSQDDPMEAASLYTFRTNPQRFFDWLRPLMDLMLAAQPNAAHIALAELEHNGPVRATITQNIDVLHQRAGSEAVLELHGNINTATCAGCGTVSPLDPLIEPVRQGQLPICNCGGVFKPDVVLFGESLPEETLNRSIHALETCDVLLVVGTSLVINPAAGLPLVALQQGARVIIVNLSSTYLDSYADVVINADLADVLPAIVEQYQLLS